MAKNCDNCIYSGRPSYEYPCTVCETAYGSAPSKWEGIAKHVTDNNVGNKWIPVSERLPDKKGEYLVAYHPCYWETVHDVFTFVGVDTFRGKTTWAKNKFQRITHWMPLPEPPKEE